MGNGIFLVFEGIDGSGKTTQLRLLAQRLGNRNLPVYGTREPTDGPIGSLVNQALKKRLKLDERVLATLFAGDRLDHLLNEYNGLCPKIKQGIHVLCDRYYLSSYAYNGSRVPFDWVMKLNEQAAQILRPTAHIFVDVTPEVAVQRIAANRYETELYETTENLRTVRGKFYEVFELLKEQETVIIVNGDLPPDQVAEEIWEKVKNYFE